MSKELRYLIGIDLGGTKILSCLFNSQFKVITSVKEKTRPQKGETHFLRTIKESVDVLLAEAHVKRTEIHAVGIGCPGIINPQTGTIALSPNISFLKDYPLTKILSKTLKLPVILGNDVKMGLNGERHFGAARGYANVIGIFIGTGIGGALILNNQLFMGSTGGAGEIGHMQMESNGPRCGCGQKGCLEALASRLAIACDAAALVARQQAPALLRLAGTDVLAIKSGALAAAVKAGDRALEQLLKTKSRWIGKAMANLVNLLNPELIVLGGGLVEAFPSLIRREAEETMRRHAMAPLAKKVRVANAKLGDWAVAMGAAKHALDTLNPQAPEKKSRG